ARVRKTGVGRGGAQPDYVVVVSHHPAPLVSQGLEDHREPLPQPGSIRRVAGQVEATLDGRKLVGATLVVALGVHKARPCKSVIRRGDRGGRPGNRSCGATFSSGSSR